MFNTVAKGKAIIIGGALGTGKTVLANIIADKYSKHTVTIDAVALNSAFGLSFLADNNVDVVIVEGIVNLDKVKPLVSGDLFKVDVQFKEPVTVVPPNFIFTTGSLDALNLPDDSRRFFTIDLKN